MGDPFCGNCGYSLVGLVDSSKCPECGRPLVQVLQREATAPIGRRFTSTTRLFGLPLVSIALGPHGGERIGRAIGIFAVGDIAIGWFTVGGALSVGMISVGGGMAVGVFALGGFALGLLALAGLSLGGLAVGGGAVGCIATGGAAVGYVAQGGAALGVFARGAAAYGPYVISPGFQSWQAVAMFDRWAWLLGTQPSVVAPFLALFAAGLLIAGLLGIVILAAYLAVRRAAGSEA